MVVVPKESQLNPSSNVALLFFQLTFGTLSKNDDLPERVLSGFLAVSSFGNIVVMTFTAARGQYSSSSSTLLLFLLAKLSVQRNKKLQRREFFPKRNSSAEQKTFPSDAFYLGFKLTRRISSIEISTGYLDSHGWILKNTLKKHLLEHCFSTGSAPLL
jgi:hypothetical protein